MPSGKPVKKGGLYHNIISKTTTAAGGDGLKIGMKRVSNGKGNMEATTRKAKMGPFSWISARRRRNNFVPLMVLKPLN